MEKYVEMKKAAKIGPHDGSKFAPKAHEGGEKKVEVVMAKEVDAKKWRQVESPSPTRRSMRNKK